MFFRYVENSQINSAMSDEDDSTSSSDQEEMTTVDLKGSGSQTAGAPANGGDAADTTGESTDADPDPNDSLYQAGVRILENEKEILR